MSALPDRIGRALTALAGLVISAAILLATGSVPAGATAAAGGAAGAKSKAAPGISLVSQPAWVAPGQPFVLRLAVGALSARRAADGTELEISVYQRLLSRSAFSETQQGRDLGRALWSNTTALGSGTGGGQTQVCVPVDTEPTPACNAPYALLTGEVPGVYPVEATLRDATTGLSEARLVTHLVLVAGGTATNRLRFALVVPVRAPAPLSTTGVRHVDPGSVSRIGALAQELAPHGTVALTLAPDPSTVSALADTAGAPARTALAGLRRLAGGTQMLAQPFAPADPYDLIGSGLSSELGRQVSRGGDVDQVELGTRPSDSDWLLSGPIDRSTASALSSLGATHLVLPSGDVSAGTSRLTTTEPYPLDPGSGSDSGSGSGSGSAGASSGRGEAISGDPALAADLSIHDPVLAAHELLADLAQTYFENPNLEYYQDGQERPEPRVVVAVAPTYWAPGRAAAAALLAELANDPIIQTVTVAQAFSQVPAAEEARSLEPASGHRTDLPTKGIRAARRRIDALAGSLVKPLPAVLAAGDLVLTSETSGLADGTRSAYLQTAEAKVDRDLDSVTVGASAITLTSRQARVPISIVSSLSVPIRVTVQLTSTRLEFSGNQGRDSLSQSFTLRLRNTTWLVPVTARTTGAFQMDARVVTQSGQVELSSARVDIRSKAFSGVGIALSVAALAVLAFWWGRALQKGRRNQRLVDRRD